MTNEEFQNLVLEKLTKLEAKIETLATKEDLEKLGFATQEDVKAMLLHVDKKVDNIENKLDVLNERTFKNEADIRYLNKAR